MYFVGLLTALLLASISAVASVGASTLLLNLFEKEPASDWSRSNSARLIVGLPLFGTVLYLCGLGSTSALALSLATTPFFLSGVRRIGSRMRREVEISEREWLGSIFLFSAAAISLLFAALPASTLDELSYHLAVPMTWVLTGRVVDLPLLSHSYFPFGTESADLLALSWMHQSGAVASHFLHVLQAAAVATLLVQRLRSSAGQGGRSLLLTSAILCTPALLLTAGWSWSDFPTVGLVLVLYLSLESLVERGSGATMVSMALAAGLLTKYTFAPIALLLCVLALLESSSERRRSLLTSVLAGGAGGSVFFLRNLLMTGNPFAPMFSSGSPAVAGYRAEGSPIATIAAYVFDTHFVDEALGVSILFLAILSIPAKGDSRFAVRAARVLLASTLLIAFLTPSSRILLPFLVVPALIGAGSLRNYGGGTRSVLFAALALAVAGQLLIASIYTALQDPLAILSGRQSVATYVEAHRRVQKQIDWIDHSLPAQSKTLVVGIQELYWFTHRVRGGGNFDGERVATFLRARSPQELGARLRTSGFTHLALAADGLRVGVASSDVRRRERETVLDVDSARVLAAFLRSTQLAGQQGSAGLYQLDRAPEASKGMR